MMLYSIPTLTKIELLRLALMGLTPEIFAMRLKNISQIEFLSQYPRNFGGLCSSTKKPSLHLRGANILAPAHTA